MQVGEGDHLEAGTHEPGTEEEIHDTSQEVTEVNCLLEEIRKDV